MVFFVSGGGMQDSVMRVLARQADRLEEDEHAAALILRAELDASLDYIEDLEAQLDELHHEPVEPGPEGPHTCDACKVVDPSGWYGPPELCGEPGAYATRADRWYCIDHAAALWARWSLRRMRSDERRELIRESMREGRARRSNLGRSDPPAGVEGPPSAAARGGRR